MSEAKAMLVCGEPWGGQPKRETGNAKCSLCAIDIIYNIASLAALTEKYGETPQLVCGPCVNQVIRENASDFEWAGGMVGGTVVPDPEEFMEQARAHRIANGGDA